MSGYQIAIDDVPRVARALAAARVMMRGDLSRHQSAVVAQVILNGRAMVMRGGWANQLRVAGVLAPAPDVQPADETMIALVPSARLLAAMCAEDPPPPVAPPFESPAYQRNPRRATMRVLRNALNLFEGGAAAWADVDAAVAALRDVVSRQCCERDNDLDGNCDVHREQWRPKV